MPADLEQFLPPATRAAWSRLAPLVPDNGYLVGGTALTVHLLHRVSRDLDFFIPSAFDPDGLIDTLAAAGPFTPTQLGVGTLNGVFEGTKVQFLDASGQHMLDEARVVAGVRVAGIRDLFATKLKVIADRGELRDYFDLLAIEQRAGLRAEDGLRLFVQRYRPRVPGQAVAKIVLGLGYLDDVADDPSLPMRREEIERYWRRRQPEIGKTLGAD
ncbi:nucleotidyl transferase AbiEii/AbiGii toxin family protein [Mycobacterium branderi]|nr:nucleotidyl transferase AbiEii/AbiGii toxin family protein [Mycobacterium branderi]MCV7234026.1 nucleotidyl transferase AbiEii/AbiGii toxin family protein [Mycobacterium branderi]